MLQHPGDELVGDRAQPVLAVRVPERVLAACEQRYVGVHAGTRLAMNRFGHEGSVQSVIHGDALDHGAERDDAVSGSERFAVTEVDLMLARTDLVMGCFDLETHLDQGDRKSTRLN